MGRAERLAWASPGAALANCANSRRPAGRSSPGLYVEPKMDGGGGGFRIEGVPAIVVSTPFREEQAREALKCLMLFCPTEVFLCNIIK